MTKIPTIAIVGRGFSGIVSAYNLVQKSDRPCQILLFDNSPYSGTGVAYSSNCPLHLLNVPASNMGALHNDPKHFFHWLQSTSSWRKLDPQFDSIDFDENSFVPRMIYGAYLKYLAEMTKRDAKPKGIFIKEIPEKITAISAIGNDLELISNNATYKVQAAVLAIGVPWTRKIPGSETLGEREFLPTFWPLTRMEEAKKLSLSPESHLGIIGSGLTMLDVLATLYHLGYEGKISIFSSRGLLPQPHTSVRAMSLQINDFPMSALKLYQKIRELCRIEDWQSIIHALRPITIELWHRLPDVEKSKVLRHLFSFWNSHRHRAAPNIRALVDFFKKSEQLEIIKTHVTSLTKEKGKIFVKDFGVPLDLIVNCSGPDLKITNQTEGLIFQLLSNHQAESDSLERGIAVDSRGSVRGKAVGKLFAIGSVLFGTHFETVAVPELRNQCHLVTSAIAQSLRIGSK